MINIFNFNKISAVSSQQSAVSSQQSAVSSQQSAVSSPKNFINLSPFIIFSLSLIFLTSCIPTTNSSANSYQNNQTTTKNINEERQEELRRQEELNRQNQENLNEQLVNAVLNKDTSQVRELLNNGADPNSKGGSGRGKHPVIYHAVFSHNEDIVRLLVNKGANIEIILRADDGESLLSTYIGNNDDDTKPEIIQFLIEKGANVNATDNDGHTPLHHLAWREDLSREYIKSIAKMLIDNGADINAKNINGFTPMDMAKRNNNEKFASVLAEYGVRSTGAVEAYEANERRKRAEYERKKTCDHVYVGRVVTLPTEGFLALFGIDTSEFEVKGFSKQSGRVTLEWVKYPGRYEEAYCTDIPE